MPKAVVGASALSLCRVLDRGLSVTGQVIISVADIDLVYLDLQLLVSAMESIARRQAGRT